MIPLERLSSAELRELGKEMKIKNWWSLSKVALITSINAITVSKEEPKQNASSIKEEGLDETNGSQIQKDRKTKLQEYEFDGKKQSLKSWAKELEIPYPTLYDRINRNGWNIVEALTIPLGGRRDVKK